jgi:hypothetical protein
VADCFRASNFRAIGLGQLDSDERA